MLLDLSFPASCDRCGVDLTRIDGIDVMLAQILISEVGLAMTTGGRHKREEVSGDGEMHMGPEGIDDIGPESAVRFGWRHHHKNIVSLGISQRNDMAFSFR
jgi:hypothetical protein